MGRRVTLFARSHCIVELRSSGPRRFSTRPARSACLMGRASPAYQHDETKSVLRHPSDRKIRSMISSTVVTGFLYRAVERTARVDVACAIPRARF